MDFGGVLGTLDLQKSVSRLGEVLFFRNSPFSELNQFWSDFSPNSACTMGFWRVKGWLMLVRIPRLPDIPGHGKSLKNNEFISFFKKNGAGARVLESTVSVFFECFS